jgi:hypothetical protein
LALEGTGSLIFDTENCKIYCALSVRADPALFTKFVSDFNKLTTVPYKGVSWESHDPQGNPVYHTNCVMAILDKHVILCTESIRDAKIRAAVVNEITLSKIKPRAIIDINYHEMLNMCGNMLMLTND